MSLIKQFDKAVLNRKLYDSVIEKFLTLNAEICERLDYQRPWEEIAQEVITDPTIRKVHEKWGGDTVIHVADFGDGYTKKLDLYNYVNNILYHCACEYSEKEATVAMAKLYAESGMVKYAANASLILKPTLSNTRFQMRVYEIQDNRKRLGQIITNFAEKVPPGQELSLAYALTKNNLGTFVLNVTNPEYFFAFLIRLAENIEDMDEVDQIFKQTKLLEGVALIPEIKNFFFGVNTPFGFKPRPELWEIVSNHCKGDLSSNFAYSNPHIADD